jgi:hypothetical protein
MRTATYPPAGLKNKEIADIEGSSPIDAWIFWSKRESLSDPQLMTDRTVEDTHIEL